MVSMTLEEHRKSKSPTYVAWVNMRQRCSSDDPQRREQYKDRGIKVCDRWRTFENFLADMGERPEGMTLDREDNDGNYAPGNCRWATPQTQSQNRRGRKMVVYQGQEMILSEAIRRSGLNRATVNNRINRSGWSAEKARTAPVGRWAND